MVDVPRADEGLLLLGRAPADFSAVNKMSECFALHRWGMLPCSASTYFHVLVAGGE